MAFSSIVKKRGREHARTTNSVKGEGNDGGESTRDISILPPTLWRRYSRLNIVLIAYDHLTEAICLETSFVKMDGHSLL